MKLLLCSSGHLLILVQRDFALSHQCPVSMKAPPTCQTAEHHSHLSLLSPFPTTQVSVCFSCFLWFTNNNAVMISVSQRPSCLTASRISAMYVHEHGWIPVLYFRIYEKSFLWYHIYYFQHTSSK